MISMQEVMEKDMKNTPKLNALNNACKLLFSESRYLRMATFNHIIATMKYNFITKSNLGTQVLHVLTLIQLNWHLNVYKSTIS